MNGNHGEGACMNLQCFCLKTEYQATIRIITVIIPEKSINNLRHELQAIVYVISYADSRGLMLRSD
jgi:hypothetical protein